jgi:hypothetical protein
MMQMTRRFAPLFLAGLSILAAVMQLVQSAQERAWTGLQEEMVTMWDARIQDVREAFPPGTDHIGYLETSDVLKTETFDIEEFLLMQYSLAPASLKRGLGDEWVVGNFNKDVDFTSWLDERITNYDVQSFGFGLYLIHILEP